MQAEIQFQRFGRNFHDQKIGRFHNRNNQICLETENVLVSPLYFQVNEWVNQLTHRQEAEH